MFTRPKGADRNLHDDDRRRDRRFGGAVGGRRDRLRRNVRGYRHCLHFGRFNSARSYRYEYVENFPRRHRPGRRGIHSRWVSNQHHHGQAACPGKYQFADPSCCSNAGVGSDAGEVPATALSGRRSAPQMACARAYDVAQHRGCQLVVAAHLPLPQRIAKNVCD